MTDAFHLLEAIERRHPAPYRYVSPQSLRRQATRAAEIPATERSRAVVELMRLAAMLGERNGHTAIMPSQEHPIPFRAYPMRGHEFEDGVFIVDADPPDLVGSELVAVAGVPLPDAMAVVTPLVAHDNEWTIRARRPEFLVVQDVLAGLGIAAGPDPIGWRVRTPEGALREVELEAVATPERESLLRRSLPPRSIKTLEGGRSLYVAYNVTRGDTAGFAAEIASRARRSDALVLDLRHNAGGDNQTYGPLLATLEAFTAEGKPLAVLISRSTFSAAMQLVVDLEQRTPAIFVGEPTGGSPNQYGDAVAVRLDNTQVVARVATISWTTAGEHDPRTAREPDIAVPVAAADFFSGNDPVLSAALSKM